MDRRLLHGLGTLLGIALAAGSAGCGGTTSLFCAIWPNDSSCSTHALKVNLQIDAEQDDTAGITNIVNELNGRGIKTTIYVSAEYANSHALLVSDFYSQGFEIALHGYHTGEQLSTMTYAEQLDLLTRAKQAVEGCLTCGDFKPIAGFRPQYFSQNEDTYRVLDELGLTYNSGFKARQLYIAGHEQDAAPYAVAGHNFTAVPITTVEYNGARSYLCDISAGTAAHLTAAQWSEMLSFGYQQALANGEPLVVLFHGWYTGDSATYDYWQPFVNFLDQIRGQADFMTTQQLVNSYAP